MPGGTSAGAMILASYIALRASLPVSAFEFLPHVAIAPHYTQRQLERRAARRARFSARGAGDGAPHRVTGTCMLQHRGPIAARRGEQPSRPGAGERGGGGGPAAHGRVTAG